MFARIITLLTLSLFFSAVAYAQGAVEVAPLTNLPGFEEASQGNITLFVNQLYQYGVGIGAILAILIIIYGGFQYMTSEAVGSKSAGREAITRAVLGLLLIMSPVIVFGLVNERILNLDFGLQRIGEGIAAGGGGGGETEVPPGQSNHCAAYSNFQKVTLTEINQTCRDVLGDGWRGPLSGYGCCSGTPGTGVCCGYDESLIPPEPRELGDFSVSAIFSSTGTDGLACKDTETRDFETLDACLEEEAFLENDPVAIEISCDGEVHDPPIPADKWANLENLPWCTN